jgi:uncharacterized protein (TIGR03067 family)
MIAASLTVLVLVPAPSPAQPDGGRDDLTGTWQLTGFETDGQRIAVVVSEVLVLDAKKGTYSLRLAAGLAGGLDQKGTFEIVGTEKGMFKVDLMYTRTGQVGESNQTATSKHTERGLWKLEGKDTLVICSTEGKDRPDSLTTKKGDGRQLNVYERKKKK